MSLLILTKNTDKISYHFELNDNILAAADCVMTDVFNSMNDTNDKESLLKNLWLIKN